MHVGDQFLSAGANDFKARLACTTAWIAGPSETVGLLDELEWHMAQVEKERGRGRGRGRKDGEKQRDKWNGVVENEMEKENDLEGEKRGKGDEEQETGDFKGHERNPSSLVVNGTHS